MATTIVQRLASAFTPFANRLVLLQRVTKPCPLVRRIFIMIPFLLLACFLLILLLPHPTTPIKTPLLALNFPDPCIIQDHPSGIWYAFASGWWTPTNTTDTTTTKPNYKNIQAASAPHPSGPWTYLPSADPLPSPGPWTAGPGPDSQTWAPSILQLPPTTTHNTTYILFYTSQTLPPSTLHCIGAATSTTSILGPYTPLPTPLICPLDLGGAIDPAVFRDPGDGRVYLLYKVDGNALGSGGECGNGVVPRRGTPIVLQEVVVGVEGGGDGDGGVRLVLVGEGVVVLDREDGDGEGEGEGEGGDGPLVEAPELVWIGDGEGGGGDKGEGGGEGVKGRYVLFYSNRCWDGPRYSVNYAVAEGNIMGPYKRADGPLIRTGDAFNITAPGGAASVPGGRWMVFHGNCPEGRCLFGAEMAVVGSTVTVS
ncbi:glycoside hydrolase family 43 protein [Chaetomium tenue]|uniref:Glycoside hydrolase family 43 protein n=1 Tax=Chaetomium tenue TaxID=1854479 RepID=A0ACB7PCK9_9PEZI|nr:glycoside hydrolase family 43 protein [Chaetomium globosum]